MGKLICLKFEEKKQQLLFIWFFFHVTILWSWRSWTGEGIVDVVKATVDILLVQSGFQYYFLFCLNKLVLS